ncbi:ATP-binding protein [Halobacteria archaeon AArc-curdl1]|uniref:histidine kinase n=1 Tax=Natronosalvus hydrolyticus TaxID=2979988 RepID=A0AAP2Z742_9EURY|nr:ATP-binding protein [Halobacteria archaeon AArc-curdl1]
MRQFGDGQRRLKLGGIAIALFGFLVTRFAVALVYEFDGSITQFVATGAIPLVLGLGLAIFGVALAVSTYSRLTVRTIALWCLLGAGGMGGVAAFSLYATGESPGEIGSGMETMVTNVILGGAVAGSLIGIQSARNERHRKRLAYAADRATVITRILRHDVLNAVTIVRGYAGLLRDGESSAKSTDAIIAESSRIEHAIENVEYLTADADAERRETVELGSVLEREIEAARARYESATIRVKGGYPSEGRVVGTERLATVFGHLLENAVEHGSTTPGPPETTVDVSIVDGPETLCVRIVDDGPGIGEEHRSRLQQRSLPTYDDPTAGFGLTISRLLVDRIGGRIDAPTDVADADGAVIEVTLRRANASGGDQSTNLQYGVPGWELGVAGGCAIIAGITMGIFLEALAGSVPIIGALYGVQNAAVGWTTHLFHSVIFGVIFAALLAQPTLERYRNLTGTMGIAVAFGVFLWLVAAGVVMPVWLSLLGIETAIPNLTAPSLVGHVIWGAMLGGCYATATDSLSRRLGGPGSVRSVAERV